MYLPEISNLYDEVSFIERFWVRHSTEIIIFGSAFLIVLAAFIYSRIPKWKARSKQKHFANSHRTVTLYGFMTLDIPLYCPYAPDIPVMEGKLFGGWFVDTALTVPWKSTDIVKSDITLYPKWI